MSTIWLVPANDPGLRVTAPFNGLGLRGNNSSPVTAEGVIISKEAMLGEDGKGFDIMMGVVLPYFQVMNAALSVGTMESATTKAASHVGAVTLEHVGQSLADFPTVRAYIARMRVKTDMVRALLLDTIDALETGREATMLRVLEIKAAAAEAATEVTDLAMRVWRRGISQGAWGRAPLPRCPCSDRYGPNDRRTLRLYRQGGLWYAIIRLMEREGHG